MVIGYLAKAIGASYTIYAAGAAMISDKSPEEIMAFAMVGAGAYMIGHFKHKERQKERELTLMRDNNSLLRELEINDSKKISLKEHELGSLDRITRKLGSLEDITKKLDNLETISKQLNDIPGR